MTITLIALTLTTPALASTVTDAKREIRRLWGPRAPTMECIIRHESNWNPNAISRTGDFGLAQLNSYTWRRHFGPRRWALVLDPVANIRMAWIVYLRQGFGAWVVYRRWCAR